MPEATVTSAATVTGTATVVGGRVVGGAVGGGVVGGVVGGRVVGDRVVEGVVGAVAGAAVLGAVVVEATGEIEGAGEQMQGMLAISPVPRIGTADDIAAAVQWLASPQASFVSGCDLRVDGGVTASS